MAKKQPLIIGGASGFWGEAGHATAQLLEAPRLDILVYDYLAEITMSILARARAKDQSQGYAGDFISAAMTPNIEKIAARGIKVISNAGGVNPIACGAALQAVLDAQNLSLKIAVVTGDDLLASASDFQDAVEMFSGEAFPPIDKISSINAYLGAFPIAAALDAGADIVITGRCVDSAVTLGAAIHHFGWKAEEFDKLAAGSLAGHILECGPQATGGNFTDWQEAGNLADIGYPLIALEADGAFNLFKPENTTGIVSRASASEQLLYEIGNPQAYQLPDVCADFSCVKIEETGENRVRITDAKGAPPSGKLKICATWQDGYRAGFVFQFSGIDARSSADSFAQAGLARARHRLRAMNAPDFSDTLIEIHGGRSADGQTDTYYEELTLKTAVRHEDARAVGLFLKETMGMGLATPPGLHGFTGAGRPAPSPVVRLFSFLLNEDVVTPSIILAGQKIPFHASKISRAKQDIPLHAPPSLPARSPETDMRKIPLIRLAWARSGDKGNIANIGVIARHQDYLPWIWHGLNDTLIQNCFADSLMGKIERFYLPGLAAMNIVLHQSLGGGGIASLMNDSQGKAFAQRLLAQSIAIPAILSKHMP